MDECRKAGLPDPEYHTDATEVRLVFKYQREQTAGHVTGHVTGQETGQVMLLVRCIAQEALSLKEIMERLGLKGRDNFRKSYLVPAMEDGVVEQTHPENPKHRGQKYRLTERGRKLLKGSE